VSKKIDAYWWKRDTKDLPEIINSNVKAIDKSQEYVAEDNIRHARLYGNADILGLSALTFSSSSSSSFNKSDNRLTLNIIKSCVDTVTNKIAKNKPRPLFLTEGGDFSLQSKAKKLTKFSDGIFYATKMHELGPKIFRDACIFNTGGFLKIFRCEDEIKAERVLSQELKFDDAESFYGNPRSMHQVKHVSRETLLEVYPKKKNAIINAPEAKIEWGANQTLSDQVSVIESWHIPSSKNAKDGRHVMTLENEVILDESWNRPYFPFVWIQWSPALLGFRGQSLASELTGIQIEINRILKTIQQILRLTVPKLFVEKGAKVVLSHLNNDIGGIVEFSGTRPSYDFLQAIPPDLFNQLDRLYSRAFEIAGVSQLSAQAKKPSGLDSGRALREFNDIESERFILKGYDYESLFLNSVRIMIDEAKEIAKDTGDFEVKVAGKKFLETIKWSEINLEDDQYQMKIFPTSSLSQTPAGRLQDIQELSQAGFISKEAGLKLLDFPDLESFMSLENAAIDDIEMLIEQMIEKGVYQTPEEYQNLQLGIKMIQSAYLRAKINKVPEDKLELLRRWMDEAAGKLGLLAQPAPQQPMAVPQAAPVSDLLPPSTVEPAQL
tara:strand:+ start:456 stop:2276 length:1821 start_codon:yes stop_codon:yes gene_type:complete